MVKAEMHQRSPDLLVGFIGFYF